MKKSYATQLTTVSWCTSVTQKNIQKRSALGYKGYKQRKGKNEKQSKEEKAKQKQNNPQSIENFGPSVTHSIIIEHD